MSQHKHFNAPALRICGHSQMSSFEYGKKARTEDARYYSNTLCGACRLTLTSLTTPVEKGFYRVTQPDLVGTERQIYAAKQRRLKAMREIGPIMGVLSKNPEPYAKLALSTYVMLFKITSAKFWIETSDFGYCTQWVIGEVEALMRKSYTAYKAGDRSAFGYWMQMDLSVINEAKLALPEVLESFHLPAQPTHEAMAQQMA